MNDEVLLKFRDFVVKNPESVFSQDFVFNLVEELIAMKTKYEGLYDPGVAPHQADPADLCNCGNHTHGAATAGWICPVHGQQF